MGVLLADLAGIAINNEQLQYVFKPLIIPVLIGYFLFSVFAVVNSLKKWVIAALFFSWVGDVLLMFDARNEIFFILGLASFLLAHIFYILYFHHVRVKQKVKSNPWLLVVVVVYYGALITWLSPYLGDMKLPVRIYGIIISFMLMMALHMLFIKNKHAGRRMAMGAVLFIISDSLLAINKFYQSFEMAGILIMLTYGLAQFFIVSGAIRYTRSANSR